MDIPPDLVAQFIGVTNAPEALAAQLLRDSGLNLESAISSFFAIQEAGGLPTSPSTNDTPTATPSSSQPNIQEDADAALARAVSQQQPRSLLEHVRPPIPQMIDTLLPAPPVPPPRVEPPPDPFVQSDGTTRGDGLANLFRHPTHLNFSDTFENAMTAGQRQSKWLLVNIQRSDIFASLVMNRDVWSDPHVEEVLQAHFIFWQRDERTPDGQRYKQFYRFDQPPHVALVDPRSGERLRVWGGDGEQIEKNALLTELMDFVEGNSLVSDANIRDRVPMLRRPSSRSADVLMQDDEDMSEDAQLAAAIAASMEQSVNMQPEKLQQGSSSRATENGGLSRNTVAPSSGEGGAGSIYADRSNEREASRFLSATDPTLNRNRSLRAQQDSEFEESLAMDRAIEQSVRAEALRKEQEAKAEERKAMEIATARKLKRRRVPPVPPPDSKERITELAIRLPTGVRLQRRFLASDTVGNVYDFIQSEVEELVNVDFELMTAYPKKSFTDREVSLEELAPKAALVVHLKN